MKIQTTSKMNPRVKYHGIYHAMHIEKYYREYIKYRINIFKNTWSPATYAGEVTRGQDLGSEICITCAAKGEIKMEEHLNKRGQTAIVDLNNRAS